MLRHIERVLCAVRCGIPSVYIPNGRAEDETLLFSPRNNCFSQKGRRWRCAVRDIGSEAVLPGLLSRPELPRDPQPMAAGLAPRDTRPISTPHSPPNARPASFATTAHAHNLFILIIV